MAPLHPRGIGSSVEVKSEGIHIGGGGGTWRSEGEVTNLKELGSPRSSKSKQVEGREDQGEVLAHS